MDPFLKISEELRYLILQHLNGKSVLDSMLVSSVWLEILIKSNHCMSKVKLALKFKDRIGTKEEELIKAKTLIHETTRCYQIFELDMYGMENYNNKLCQLLSIFMRKAQDYLTDLIINGWEFRPQEGRLDLSRIQSLHMINVYIPVRCLLLETATSLKTLKIEMKGPDCTLVRPAASNMRYLRHFMEINSTLERFEVLGQMQFSSLSFHTFWETTNFQLKSLKIENNGAPNFPDHFIRFMENQSKSIESFSYDGKAAEAITFAFNQLPVLNHLLLGDSLLGGILSLPTGSLITNETLSVLELPNFDHHLGAENILKLTPNITRLVLHYLTHGVVEYVARNLRKMRFLKYYIDPYTDQNDCLIFYNQLKEEDPSVNRKIVLFREYWCTMNGSSNSLPNVFDLEL